MDGFNSGGVLLRTTVAARESGIKVAGMLFGTMEPQAAGSQPGQEVSGRVRVEVCQMTP